MGQYSEVLIESDLYKQFDRIENTDGLKATDCDQLKGLLVSVVDHIGPHLDRIRDTFKQYTEHDLRHLCNIAKLAYKILPKYPPKRRPRIRLNPLELAILWLGILLHDIGMYVTPAEKQALLDSNDYKEYLRHEQRRVELAASLRAAGQLINAQMIDDSLLAEFIRRRHATRIRRYIENELEPNVPLRFHDNSLVDLVVDLCESHAWGVLESHNPRNAAHSVRQLPANAGVGGIPVNLQYLACILRLGDILDFDKSRTPPSVYEHMDFTEQKSLEEWNKHLSVEQWTVDERGASFTAACTEPIYYVAVQEFLNWVDAELRDCRYLLDEAPAAANAKYALEVAHVVDRRRVRMKNDRFIAGGFHFQLEYNEIMKLLMDRSLYPSPTLFLRELLQNSLDACRFQKALAASNNMPDKYVPRIVVWDHSQDAADPRIVFMDNGVGMSRRVVEDFFLRVGKSYYRSDEFKAERARLAEQGLRFDATSQFGIGFLSCFLGGDHIEIDTYRYGNEPLHIDITGADKYFVIERKDPPPLEREVKYNSPADASQDGPPHHAGTSITVHLRPDWLAGEEIASKSGGDADIVFTTLDSFAVNQDCPIGVVLPGHPPRTIVANAWQNAPDEERLLRQSLSKYGPVGADVLSNCQSVLVSTTVPLQEFEFAENLDGRVGFWLLNNGDGVPRPRCGVLQISPDDSELLINTRILSLIASINDMHLDEPRRRSVSLILAKTATEDVNNLIDELWTLFGREFDRSRWTDIVRSARYVPPEDFELLAYGIENCSSISIGAGSPVRSSGAIAMLARNELEQILRIVAKESLAINFSWTGAYVQSTYDLASFGVLAPGGFSQWNASEGFASRQSIGPMTSWVQIDLVGRSDVQLAASRLFAPAADMGPVQRIVNRALLCHALSLVHEGDDSAGWGEWMRDVVKAVGDIAPEAIVDEWASLEPWIRFPCVVDEEHANLSPVELRDRFGVSVPIQSGNEHDSDGLLRHSWLVSYLSNGESDMESISLSPLAEQFGL